MPAPWIPPEGLILTYAPGGSGITAGGTHQLRVDNNSQNSRRAIQTAHCASAWRVSRCASACRRAFSTWLSASSKQKKREPENRLPRQIPLFWLKVRRCTESLGECYAIADIAAASHTVSS